MRKIVLPLVLFAVALGVLAASPTKADAAWWRSRYPSYYYTPAPAYTYYSAPYTTTYYAPAATSYYYTPAYTSYYYTPAYTSYYYNPGVYVYP
jgi:hypothetical protein